MNTKLKKNVIAVILMMVTFTTVLAQDSEPGTTPSDPLIGEWTIDLRPEPTAEGYYQVFQVTESRGQYIYRYFLWKSN